MGTFYSSTLKQPSEFYPSETMVHGSCKQFFLLKEIKTFAGPKFIPSFWEITMAVNVLS